jgi:hypothetical protein
MTEPKPPFFTRLLLALRAFWRTLSDAEFAAGVARLSRGELAGHPAESRPALRETAPESALQLLGLLQQEGRFVDFLEDNVSAYSDAEIGGAARVVHEGCRKALQAYLSIAPVRPESEGSRLTVPPGFDPASVRLTGKVVGRPPFTGTLMHRGWRVTEVKLPQLAEGHDVRILTPAEVEL